MSQTFPEVLRAYQRDNDVSWREIGRRTNLDASNLIAISKGHSVPEPATIRIIVEKLGLPDLVHYWIDQYAQEDVEEGRRRTKP